MRAARAIFVRAGAAVLLAMFVFAATASDFVLYRCLSSGRTRTSCCCEEERAGRTERAFVRACCDVERVSFVQHPSERTRSVELRSRLLASAVFIARPLITPAVAPAEAPPGAADPPSSPPLVQRPHQRLI